MSIEIAETWKFLMQYTWAPGIYWMIVGVSAIHVFVRGGTYEMFAATTVIVASIATAHWKPGGPWFESVRFETLVIDTIFEVVLIAIALGSDRYWPIWAAGFNSLNVATHIAVMVGPPVMPVIYYQALTIWSYLVIVSINLGAEAYWRENAAVRRYPEVPPKRQDIRGCHGHAKSMPGSNLWE